MAASGRRRALAMLLAVGRPAPVPAHALDRASRTSPRANASVSPAPVAQIPMHHHRVLHRFAVRLRDGEADPARNAACDHRPVLVALESVAGHIGARDRVAGYFVIHVQRPSERLGRSPRLHLDICSVLPRQNKGQHHETSDHRSRVGARGTISGGAGGALAGLRLSGVQVRQDDLYIEDLAHRYHPTPAVAGPLPLAQQSHASCRCA